MRDAFLMTEMLSKVAVKRSRTLRLTKGFKEHSRLYLIHNNLGVTFVHVSQRYLSESFTCFFYSDVQIFLARGLLLVSYEIFNLSCFDTHKNVSSEKYWNWKKNSRYTYPFPRLRKVCKNEQNRKFLGLSMEFSRADTIHKCINV